MAQSIDRRRLIAGSLLGSALLTSTGGLARSRQATPAPDPTSGEWSYTDFRGEAITLPARPERIAASLLVAAALWDAGVRVDAVFDWVAMQDPDGTNAMWGNIDPASVEIISDSAEGWLDAELAVAFGPDLFLTNTWTAPDYYLDQINPDQIPAIEQIAPIGVAIGPEPFEGGVARVENLAVLLGADPQDPALRTAREEFDTTLVRFVDVAAEKTDLTVSFINFTLPNEGTFWVAGPDGSEDIRFWTDHGLNVITPEGAGAENGGWVELSIEQALLYPTDILFFSSGISEDLAPHIAADPILGQHPAVLAGQIGEWNQGMVVSRPQMTTAMQRTLDVLEGATRVT